MDENKLVELLNEALQREYTDVFLYPRYADTIKEKEISETFKRFALMELRHADNIAMQIHILRGKPHWEFTPLKTKESLHEMVREHIEREKSALSLYSKLIEFVEKEEGYEQLKLILRGIKSEEASHLKAMNELAEKVK